MSRPPLSNAEEESIFQRMDDACDVCAAGLKAHILKRWADAGKGLHRPSLALALAYGSPSAVRVAARGIAPPAPRPWKPKKLKLKAKRNPLTQDEAEFIEGAVEDGIEFGLETLPAKIRDKVDVEAATALAKRRLANGVYRQNLAAFDESLRGLEAVVNATRDPSIAALRDPERLAQMFGLNARQAETIFREAKVLIDNGKQLEAIRRVMAKRIREALEARAEMLGQTLAQEAMATAQQALYDTARRQGLLDDEKTFKEWITRRDEKVCPRCDAFDHKRVPVDEMFVSDTGETAYQPGIHPRCRCRTRLVTVRTPARARRVA